MAMASRGLPYTAPPEPGPSRAFLPIGGNSESRRHDVMCQSDRVFGDLWRAFRPFHSPGYFACQRVRGAEWRIRLFKIFLKGVGPGLPSRQVQEPLAPGWCGQSPRKSEPWAVRRRSAPSKGGLPGFDVVLMFKSRVEHVFAEMKGRMGLVVRTVGLARAKAAITLANMANNMKRWPWSAPPIASQAYPPSSRASGISNRS